MCDSMRLTHALAFPKRLVRRPSMRRPRQTEQGRRDPIRKDSGGELEQESGREHERVLESSTKVAEEAFEFYFTSFLVPFATNH